MPPTRRKAATPTPPVEAIEELPPVEPLPELEQIRIGLDRIYDEVKALEKEINDGLNR